MFLEIWALVLYARDEVVESQHNVFEPSVPPGFERSAWPGSAPATKIVRNREQEP